MQETLISEDVDLTKIAAIQQKRTLAFVNHFVITTVQFINNFSKQCEQKLMRFERKLEKINASIVLLEARLSSIPEVSILTDTIKPKESLNDDHVKNELKDNEEEIKEVDDITCEEKRSPEYERFVKMVHVGVPVDAVKLKLCLEGLDPKIFDKLLGK